MYGLQSRLVYRTISREHVLWGGSVVLVNIPVGQVSRLGECDTARDEVGRELHNAVIVRNVRPCYGDIDHYEAHSVRLVWKEEKNAHTKKGTICGRDTQGVTAVRGEVRCDSCGDGLHNQGW